MHWQARHKASTNLHILNVNIGVDHALIIDSTGELLGSSQLGIGLTASAKACSIDEPYPTVIAGLGGIPALAQYLTILEVALYARNHGVAALVAQEQIATLEDGNNSVAVEGERSIVLQCVSLGQESDTFLLTTTTFIGEGSLGQIDITLRAASITIRAHD